MTMGLHCPHCGKTLFHRARMDGRGMTRRMHQALDIVANYLIQHGNRAPRYREIADAMGLKAHSNVQRIVASLLQRGLVTQTRHSSDLALTPAGWALYGRDAEGKKTDAG